MKTETRPIWWQKNHEQAFQTLPDKFTPVLELNEDNGISPLVYEQLTQAGYAECLHRQWTPGTKPMGHVCYRRVHSLAESV